MQGENYRNHLIWELEAAKAKANGLATEARQKEARWLRAVERRRQAEVAEAKCADDFRLVHRALSDARQEVGELQDELFPWAEDHD